MRGPARQYIPMAPMRAARGPEPPPHLKLLKIGGDSDGASEMLPSLTPSPWGTGGRPSSLPSQPLQSVGKGSPVLCFRGRLREGRSLAQSYAAQQELDPGSMGCPTSRQSCRAVLALVDGGGINWGSRRIMNSLSLDLDDKVPTHHPSSRLPSTTTLGCLIS